MIRMDSARRRDRGSCVRGKSARAISALGAALKGTLGGALLLGSSLATAQTIPDADAPASAVQSADAFRQQADRLAVQRCANLFSAIGQTAAAGSTYAVQVRANSENPDGHAVQGVAGMTYDTPEMRGQAAGVVLAAPVGDACEGQMVRVAPFQQPCPQILGLLPSGSTEAAKLAGVPLYDLGGNQGQALLVTSGDSCVVVTIAQMAVAE